MFNNRVEHVFSLLLDILIFWIKSFYFIIETIILTLIPNKFRKLKVRLNSKFYLKN